MAENTQRDHIPLPNTEANDSREYEIIRILDSKIEKNADGVIETKFLVEWAPTGDKTWENTWEPFEVVSHLPLLMTKFRSFSKAKILEPMGAVSQETINSISPFPVPSKEILAAFKLPDEIIPNGTETIVDMVNERGDGNKKMWGVIFREHSFVKFVRRSLMIYLFPVQSCYFTMELKRKFEILEERIRDEEKKMNERA